MWTRLFFFDMVKKRVKKFTALPDSKEGQVLHFVLKYKILSNSDVIKVRIKYNYLNNTLDIKAMTGAVKNPNLCNILSCAGLAQELNCYLDKYVTFESRLTGQMIRDQLARQNLIYPF